MQPKQILLLAFTLGVTSEAKVLPFARSENSLLDKLLAKRDSDGKEAEAAVSTTVAAAATPGKTSVVTLTVGGTPAASTPGGAPAVSTAAASSVKVVSSLEPSVSSEGALSVTTGGPSSSVAHTGGLFSVASASSAKAVSSLEPSVSSEGALSVSTGGPSSSAVHTGGLFSLASASSVKTVSSLEPSVSSEGALSISTGGPSSSAVHTGGLFSLASSSSFPTPSPVLSLSSSGNLLTKAPDTTFTLSLPSFHTTSVSVHKIVPPLSPVSEEAPSSSQSDEHPHPTPSSADAPRTLPGERHSTTSEGHAGPTPSPPSEVPSGFTTSLLHVPTSATPGHQVSVSAAEPSATHPAFGFDPFGLGAASRAELEKYACEIAKLLDVSFPDLNC